jgi:glycosyltransferase 2 family protein
MAANSALSASAPAIVESVSERKPSHIIHWILALSLAAALLWWTLRGVDWHRVAGLLSRARWTLVALACTFSSLACFFRSLRWRLLLSARHRLGAATVFWATMAGYLSNNLLPARAGEFIRSVIISRRSTLSKTYVLTTALTERLTDTIVLVVASRLLLTGIQQKPAWLDGASITACVLGLLGLAVVLLVRFSHGTIRRALSGFPLPLHLGDRLKGLLEQVVLGFSALDDTGRLARFCGLTALIWVADAAGSMIMARALGLTLSFSVAVLLLTALGLGSALPSTPGYIGVYQYVAITVLVPFAFTRDEALAYILLAQAAGYVVITFWGTIGFWRTRWPGLNRE